MMKLSAEDRLAIQELIARFYLAVDNGDAAGFAATFAEDGVFVVRRGDRDAPSEHLRGAAIEQYGVRFSGPDRPRLKHFLGNYVIEPQAEGARVIFSILNVEIMDGPTPIGTATGDCLVRKAGEHWRLACFDHYIDPAYLKRQ